MADETLKNDSPSVREIIKQVMIMLENGHPTAPFLRALAKKIEKGEIKPPEKRGEPKSADVYRISDYQRSDH